MNWFTRVVKLDMMKVGLMAIRMTHPNGNYGFGEPSVVGRMI